MQSVMIVGAGKGGLSILKILQESTVLKVVAVVDLDQTAPGLRYAHELGIQTGAQWESFLSSSIDIVIEVTGNRNVFTEIYESAKYHSVVIPGTVAYVMAKLLEEKEELLSEFKNETTKHELIFNAMNDGILMVDRNSKVIFINNSALSMIGVQREEVLYEHVLNFIPTSRLPHILSERSTELNQEQLLANGQKIITTRMPLVNDREELVGAFAVFKDITEVVQLAEELTNLKALQTMLHAVIQSSDEAISVVDEKGNGIIINPAYTRLTGLTEEQVIGKPATIDISEGESMHLKVLATRQTVRGASLRVGPMRKEVVVNVAPVIVDDDLKGSVGVIHDMSEIRNLNRELSRARQIIRTLEAKYTFEDIIGESKEMKMALEQAQLGAMTPATILLRGESGTGKELFAHAIHNASERKYNKFIRVNCAALNESLLESELFGYEEGAFSGAKRGGKIGLFEEANNGSIFLDEIGELTANMQAKLLRVLQENEITRVGGTKSISINVRVIAASNVHMEKAISNGTFREDLYYRLTALPIYIPPLRNRLDDLPLLCQRLLHKINQEYGRNVVAVSEDAIHYLKQYEWPGNVRELENILGRAIIYMGFNESIIDVTHLTTLSFRSEEVQQHTITQSEQTLSSLLNQYERDILISTLKRMNGNKTESAKALGLSIRNLYYKLEKHGIEK